MAHQVALDGAQVYILARNPTKLQEAKDSIKLSTGRESRDVTIFSPDIRDFDAIDKAIKDAVPIDVLIWNQGIFVP
ncbi:hypothetical protein ACH5RR_013149 [Cinchona calisaya]|uniref:Uncharacterized protein n=1 Tax=Cinchona calisaya TaxID=153742 RepID=A0ABD3A2V5_9GENT